MRFKEWTATLVAVVTARIQRRVSMTGLSGWLKKGTTFVFKVLSHRRGPRVGDTLHFLEAAGDENPVDACHQAFETLPRDVVRILACNREHQGLAPNPFLEKMGPRLLALAKGEPEEGSRPWRSRLPIVRRLERVRLVDHKLAARKLEALIDLGVGLLERRTRSPAKALGDLACALASLAAVYRQAGRRDDALDVFLLAHPLTVRAGDAKVEGLWRQKAAYLLVDFDRCDRAQEFLEEALARFSLADARIEEIEVLVDMGYVFYNSGLFQEAKTWLRRAAPLVPANHREYRFAIHQLLALQLSSLGEFSEALAELERAEAWVDEDKLALASLHWARGGLAGKLHDLDVAFASYKTGLSLYEKHGSEALVAALTLEYAELLLRANRRPELLELTAGSARWLAEAKRNRKIQEALENLLALAAMKQLDVNSIAKLREKLPPLDVTPARRAKRCHPPGGYAGPYSGSSAMAPLLFSGESGVSAGTVV